MHAMTETFATVLVVGSLHYDIMVEADHLPRRDETAVGSRWFPKFGGKGGNQAVAVRAAGCATRMVGAVGDDDFGTFLRGRLNAAGVDHAHVAVVPGVGSGMSVAIVDAGGDYAATIVSGANLHISAQALAVPQVWDDVALLILQNEVPAAINQAAGTQARRRGIATLLNAAPARDLARDLEVDLAALVDILVVNAVEAEMMGAPAVTDLASAARAAQTLSSRFATVIVTAGAQGLACHSVAAVFTLPAEKVTVVSSHGAGDAFIGALAAGLVAGQGIKTACTAASQAAALHVAGAARNP